jgi:hypothetical protein
MRREKQTMGELGGGRLLDAGLSGHFDSETHVQCSNYIFSKSMIKG